MKLITYSITTLLVFTFLIGCTSVPKDLGRSDVDALIGERGLPVDTKATQDNKDDFINSLLEKPLTAESAIRIALVNNPKLILADEPTGNLDSTNGNEVMDLLIDLNEAGTTIVMVTHSEHDAKYSHRIIRMLDGQKVTENILA